MDELVVYTAAKLLDARGLLQSYQNCGTESLQLNMYVVLLRLVAKAGEEKKKEKKQKGTLN